MPLWAVESRLNTLLDSQLLDPVAQRAEGHSQHFCSRRLVVSGLLERLENGVALDILEMVRLAPPPSAFAAVGAIVRRRRAELNVADVNFTARGQT